MVSRLILLGVIVFYYRKIRGWEIINTQLVSSVEVRGLYFNNAR